MTIGRAGVIGRFKPPHLGAALMLEAICSKVFDVTIGIGSSNKYNIRNPFTPAETEGMLKSYLRPRFDNFRIYWIPDFAQVPAFSDGEAWRRYVVERFGPLDFFVTSNSYVASLLENDYDIVHPVQLIEKGKLLPLKAAQVRVALARGADWRSLVPEPVADYMEHNGLAQRFQQEFGLQTLAELVGGQYMHGENAAAEKLHAMER